MFLLRLTVTTECAPFWEGSSRKGCDGLIDRVGGPVPC